MWLMRHPDIGACRHSERTRQCKPQLVALPQQTVLRLALVLLLRRSDVRHSLRSQRWSVEWRFC